MDAEVALRRIVRSVALAGAVGAAVKVLFELVAAVGQGGGPPPMFLGMDIPNPESMGVTTFLLTIPLFVLVPLPRGRVRTWTLLRAGVAAYVASWLVLGMADHLDRVDAGASIMFLAPALVAGLTLLTWPREPAVADGPLADPMVELLIVVTGAFAVPYMAAWYLVGSGIHTTSLLIVAAPLPAFWVVWTIAYLVDRYRSSRGPLVDTVPLDEGS